MASVTERYPLTTPGSSKSTYHLVLDLRGSGMHYKVGDSIAIYPLNDPAIVLKILDRLGVSGDENIITKKGETVAFSEFLSSRANLNRCSKKLLTLLTERQIDSSKKSLLESVLAADASFVKQHLESRELWDLLHEHPEAPITPQEIADLQGPLLPRFYSIASAMEAEGEIVHLTVAVTQYATNGHLRTGVCSHFLCDLVPLHLPAVPTYLQPSKDFTLPANTDAPIIMVGPGTGVAPFRGFMQERMAKQSKGKNWLFFGECNREHDFFYEDFWMSLVNNGHLRLDLAFSRDQTEKIYVQHRLAEQAADIYAWLEEGAYFYVCGDAEHMAKDVESTLQAIIEPYHGTDGAKAYIKALREQGRYLRDVY